MNRRAEILILLAILAVATCVRLWGIDWGLPHPYHPDEGSVLFHSLGFGTGDLNPHWFRWPSLSMYEMFGVYGVYFVIGKLSGIFAAPADLVRQYLTDLTPFWLLGRLASAAAGVATVWVSFLIGRRAYGRFAGLVSAAVMAVVYLHVRDSHYATPDVLTTLLASVSLLLSVSACRSGRARTLILSGLFAGLAASAKYPGALAGVGTAAAFFFLLSRRRIAPAALVAVLFAAVAGFVVGTPFSVLSFPEFSRDILMQFTMVSTSGAPVFAQSFGQGVAEIFSGTLARGVGYPVLALALVGCLAPSRLWGGLGTEERGPVGPTAAGGKAVLVSYVVAVLVVMSLLTVKRSTYLTPALPAIAVLAAAGLEAVFVSWKRPGRVAAASAAVLVVLILTAMPSLEFDRALGTQDTRTRAKDWVETNISPGARIAIETYGPVLNPTIEQLGASVEGATTAVESWEGPKRRLAELKLEVGRERAPQFELYGINWGTAAFRLPDPWEQSDALASAMGTRGIQYVILSSKAQQYRPMEGAAPPAVETEWAFSEWLAGNARLVRRFTAEREVPVIDRGIGRSFHNPVIEIYEVTRASAIDESRTITREAGR